jgi:hypothetical protein
MQVLNKRQHKNKLNLLGFFLLLMGCFYSCSEVNSVENSKDRLLAQVGSKSLYISEMEGMFPEGISGEDSVLVIESYVGRWVREAAILNEAERNIPADLNINKMVRDYRASLVRSNYEKILVEQLLDSVVTEQELVN